MRSFLRTGTSPCFHGDEMEHIIFTDKVNLKCLEIAITIVDSIPFGTLRGAEQWVYIDL
jgi:hypothetical protein